MFSLIRGRSLNGDALLDAGSEAPSSGAASALQALKAAGFSARYPEPTDPEYVRLRAATDALTEALEAALARAKAVDGAWSKLASEQAAFASALQVADRRDEALRDGPAAAAGLAKAAAGMTSTQGINPASNGGRRRNLPHSVALEQVRRYLAHLKAIQGRYRDVCKAKAEYDGFAAKVTTLKGRPQNASNAASLAKYTERATQSGKMYDAMLARLIERMGAAMDRKSCALSMINNAFWLQQARLHTQMGQVQEPAYDAARATEPLLVSSNLVEGLTAPSGMFTALDTRVVVCRRLPSTKSARDGSSRGGGGGVGTDVTSGPNTLGGGKRRLEQRRYQDLAPLSSR